MTPEYIRERWDHINAATDAYGDVDEAEMTLELFWDVADYLYRNTKEPETKHLLRELVGDE